MTILGVTASSILKISSAYESIATATGTGSSATITFSSIPSTYRHLQIRGIARDTFLNNPNQTSSFEMYFNNVTTGTSYSSHYIDANGLNATGGAQAATFYMLIANSFFLSGGTANVMGGSIIDILDYADTSKNTTVRYITGADGNTGNTSSCLAIGSALFNNTAAISQITIKTGFTAWATTTQFALYGIRGS